MYKYIHVMCFNICNTNTPLSTCSNTFLYGYTFDVYFTNNRTTCTIVIV